MNLDTPFLDNCHKFQDPHSMFTNEPLRSTGALPPFPISSTGLYEEFCGCLVSEYSNVFYRRVYRKLPPQV